MTVLADDPCADVRRALAEAVSGARDAPRHLVVALANDEAQVAAPLLARSPAADGRRTRRLRGERRHRGAVRDRASARAWRRAGWSAGGSRPAGSGAGAYRQSDRGPHARALCAGCLPGSATTPEFREALLARRGLPASLRVDLALAAASALARFVGSAGWLGGKRAERIAREARDAALVSIAADCEPQERAELVRMLRERRALTMALLLRSLLEGERDLATAALAELSGTSLCPGLGLCPRSAWRGFRGRRACLRSSASCSARVPRGARRHRYPRRGIPGRLEAAARPDNDHGLRSRARSGAGPDPVASVAVRRQRRLGRRRELPPTRRTRRLICRQSSTLRRPTTNALDGRPYRAQSGLFPAPRGRFCRTGGSFGGNRSPSKSPRTWSRRSTRRDERRAQVVIAGSSLRAARASSIARRRSGTSCAPGTPKRPAKMKNGTPVTPIACASAISRRTPSTSAPFGETASSTTSASRPLRAATSISSGAVADIAPLVEIGAEQAVDDLVLRAGRSGPADQPMRVERVRARARSCRSEGDADLGAERARDGRGPLQPPVVAEFAFQIGRAVEPALRNGRVELVGSPAHSDRLRFLGRAPLEPFLAEIAPRANDVAHDVDGQRVVLRAHAVIPMVCASIRARRRALGRSARRTHEAERASRLAPPPCARSTPNSGVPSGRPSLPE